MRSFSFLSRIRRQHRSSANRAVLRIITDDAPISKIGGFTQLRPRDVYRRIDFIYDRVVDITARHEGTFEKVDWTEVGWRFSSDPRALHLNWPNRKTLYQIVVQNVCMAHANAGYIVAAHLGHDPVATMPDIERRMNAAGDFAVPRAFRKQTRVWSEIGFKVHLYKITRDMKI